MHNAMCQKSGQQTIASQGAGARVSHVEAHTHLRTHLISSGRSNTSRSEGLPLGTKPAWHNAQGTHTLWFQKHMIMVRAVHGVCLLVHAWHPMWTLNPPAHFLFDQQIPKSMVKPHRILLLVPICYFPKTNKQPNQNKQHNL